MPIEHLSSFFENYISPVPQYMNFILNNYFEQNAAMRLAHRVT